MVKARVGTKAKKHPTQIGLLREYYKKYPNKNISHPEVVDWATNEWKKRTGKIFRDPDRGIRTLYQKDYLIMVKKGCYRYNPTHTKNYSSKTDFTQKQKDEIQKRDKYKCVICGHGQAEGFELHVDHIRSRERGGQSTLKNGQTLCSDHNMFKKNHNQTEMSKRLFIKLYKTSKAKNDYKIQNFCCDILKIYQKHKIDTHIKFNFN